MKTKQVIVWRQDLQNVPLGKKMAQAAHASHQFLTHSGSRPFSDAEKEWMKGNYRELPTPLKGRGFRFNQ